MDLKYDVAVKQDEWIILWDAEQDKQEAKYRELTGDWLWNAIDRKLTSLGGVVYLTHHHGTPAMEVQCLVYSDSLLTFDELQQAKDFDMWA